MRITGFSRINTRIRPGAELAVVQVSDGDPDPVGMEGIRRDLESMRHSMDGVAIVGDGVDPLSSQDLFSILKGIHVRGLETTLVSKGSSIENLDDLVGAGYIGFLNLELSAPISETQAGCLQVMRDNGRQYMATIVLGKDVFDEDSLRSTCMVLRDAKHVILKNAGGKDALAQKDLVSLSKPLKGLVRDLRMV